jgi:Domain of unknown function (DUF4440)
MSRQELNGLQVVTVGFMLAACSSQAPREASPGAPSACAATPQEATAQIARLEQEWETALYGRDTAFFERTLAEDFVLVESASTGGKADFIRHLPTDPPAATPNVTADLAPGEDIRAFGDVVVASGLWTDKTNPTNRRSYTELFVCRNGRWQAVYGHYNSVASN